VGILRAAVAAGWKDAAHIIRDPKLAPLRDRDDFRKLAGEVFDRAFPAKAFVP
jgi:hypothetical protein